MPAVNPPVSDPSAGPGPADEQRTFVDRIRSHLDGGTFAQLTLGKYRGPEPGLKQIVARRVTIRGRDGLSMVFRYATRDITRNVTLADGVAELAARMGGDFRSAHLLTRTEDLHLEFNKKGRATLGFGPATHAVPPATGHDREKRRVLDPALPFLRALGVTDDRHRVRPSMTGKWKQINVFLEIFRRAFADSPLISASAVRAADFGSGKGYLTFALHDFLRRLPGVEARVTGIEIREDLVALCRKIAGDSGLDGLEFCRGDWAEAAPRPIDVLVALHACDTATDLAIHTGIRAGAAIIMTAPCCHKEIRPQITAPAPLEPVLRFGVHLGQESEMVTDSLRALWMEAHGYAAQVFEFVSPEHTARNRMILGVRSGRPFDPEPIRARIAELKRFYGIRRHRLEDLLSGANSGSEFHPD